MGTNLPAPAGRRDELWARAAARILAARGWSLRPLERLGRPRRDRRTWLAEGEAGTVVVKVDANPFAPERGAAWLAEALSAIRARGYPVPELLWQGALDAQWRARRPRDLAPRDRRDPRQPGRCPRERYLTQRSITTGCRDTAGPARAGRRRSGAARRR